MRVEQASMPCPSADGRDRASRDNRGTVGPIGFSVIIATKGRPAILRRTLESLSNCHPAPDEVIVVDGDEHRSGEPVAGELHGDASVRYVAGEAGLTRQRNVGVGLASEEAVVFLDDDVVVEPRLFAALAEAYADPSVIGATGKVVEDQGRRFGNMRSGVRRLLPGGGGEGSMTRFGYPRRIQDLERSRDVEFMSGCLMSARRTAAERLRFDEGLPGYGLAEDEDFSYRLSRLGRIRYLPSAVVHHENTGARASGTREFNRAVVVNRAYLFRKNFERTPLARLQFALLVLILMVHRAVNREWAGVRGLAEGSLQAWRSRP